MGPTSLLSNTKSIVAVIEDFEYFIIPPSSLLSEAFSGPSNLQFTGQTSDSLRFRWSQAGGPVSGYVVQYTPLSGLGQPNIGELRQVSPVFPADIPDTQR